MTAIVLNPLFVTHQLVTVCVRLENGVEYVSVHAVMASLELTVKRHASVKMVEVVTQ